jgi:hypothetical protein
MYRRAKKSLDEKRRRLVRCYEVAQRAEDSAITEPLALLEQSRRGWRETDTLTLEAFERVHFALNADECLVGAEELGPCFRLALTHLTIFGPGRFELGGADTEAGDRIDGGESTFVSLAPNHRQKVGELGALGIQGIDALRDLVDFATSALALMVDAQRSVIGVAELLLGVVDRRACGGNDGA